MECARSSFCPAPSDAQLPPNTSSNAPASTFNTLPHTSPPIMSFAILGANATLVPNRVRVAKSANNKRCATTTVAVRTLSIRSPKLDFLRQRDRYLSKTHTSRVQMRRSRRIPHTPRRNDLPEFDALFRSTWTFAAKDLKGAPF